MNKIDWNKPDKDGNVDVPDELMPLLNKFMVQCHLHATAKGMRIQGIVNMVDIAERFFASKSIPQPDQLPDVGKTIPEYGCSHPEKDNGGCPFNENTSDCIGCQYRLELGESKKRVTFPSSEEAEGMGTLKRLQDYPFYDEQYLDGWMECYDWLVKQIPTLPLTAQQFADEPVSAEIAHTETDVKIPIWTNECPECDGIVTLYEKGGIASCDSCTREFTTDYEEHPELDQSQTEYWLVDVYIPKPIRNDSFSSKLRSKIFADELTERWVNIESQGTLKFFDWLKSELLKPQREGK